MSRLLLTHEKINPTISHETASTKRPRRIRPFEGLGRGRYSSDTSGSVGVGQGLGKSRRRGLVVRQSNRHSDVLGWSTEEAKSLSGVTSTSSSRQGEHVPDFTSTDRSGEVAVISNHLRLYNALAYLNCRRAVNFMIYALGVGNNIVLFFGEVTTIDSLLFLVPEYADKLALTCQIRFWGGPPSKSGFFSGNLLAALCDAIMQTTCSGNWAIYNRFLDLPNYEEK